MPYSPHSRPPPPFCLVGEIHLFPRSLDDRILHPHSTSIPLLSDFREKCSLLTAKTCPVYTGRATEPPFTLFCVPNLFLRPFPTFNVQNPEIPIPESPDPTSKLHAPNC